MEAKSSGLCIRLRPLAQEGPSGRGEEPLGPYIVSFMGPAYFLLAYYRIFLRFVGLIPIGIFHLFVMASTWPI